MDGDLAIDKKHDTKIMEKVVRVVFLSDAAFNLK